MEMSVCSMASGVANYYANFFTGNSLEIVKSAHSCIGAAFSLASALQMRYSTYDFIFEYAEKGEDCMKEFMIFTMQNLLDIYINVVAFVGSVAGEIPADATGWISTIYSFVKHMQESFDGDSDVPSVMDTISLIWDLIGKLL